MAALPAGQFRVWDTCARGSTSSAAEWQECLGLCRSILGRCEDALSRSERRLLFLRLAMCAQKLGDVAAERAWRSSARGRGVERRLSGARSYDVDGENRDRQRRGCTDAYWRASSPPARRLLYG